MRCHFKLEEIFFCNLIDMLVRETSGLQVFLQKKGDLHENHVRPG